MMTVNDVKTMHIYKNKKNKHDYRVLDIVNHSEPLEDGSIQKMVLYQPLYGNTTTLWVRPLELFLEKFEVSQ